MTKDAKPRVSSVAVFGVDRWYRGSGSTEASLRFVYSQSMGVNGHDCINFRPDTYWVVFASDKYAPLELIDDCEGALAISSRLGPNIRKSGRLAQMEADFRAGLKDNDSEARIYSIQRLVGLKLPSSRSALHQVIEQRDGDDAKWAIYATLRTGDVSVLPLVNQLLKSGDHSNPESATVFELEHVSEPSAVPDLLEILRNAPDDLTRSRVLIALVRNLKDPRAVPVLAASLYSSDVQIRYLALQGLSGIANAEACNPHVPEHVFEQQAARCKVWWEQEGKSRDWTAHQRANE
jgi:hypothetical protein